MTDTIAKAESDQLLNDIVKKPCRPARLNRFKPGKAGYGYQRQAVDFAIEKGGLLLLNDVGFGKTISALATLVEYGQYPSAVVLDPHLADQWTEE